MNRYILTVTATLNVCDEYYQSIKDIYLGVEFCDTREDALLIAEMLFRERDDYKNFEPLPSFHAILVPTKPTIKYQNVTFNEVVKLIQDARAFVQLKYISKNQDERASANKRLIDISGKLTKMGIIDEKGDYLLQGDLVNNHGEELGNKIYNFLKDF